MPEYYIPGPLSTGLVAGGHTLTPIIYATQAMTQLEVNDGLSTKQGHGASTCRLIGSWADAYRQLEKPIGPRWPLPFIGDSAVI